MSTQPKPENVPFWADLLTGAPLVALFIWSLIS